ncbi:hypothetical protein ACOSP7_027699 [Xanthoceras sorbifolium]
MLQILVLILFQTVKVTNNHKEVVLEIEEEKEEAKMEVDETMATNLPSLIQSTAYYATPETVCDQAWYPDSGATNHVTSDLNNLSTHSEYKGNDRLAVGNGQQLNRSHIFNSIIQSSLSYASSLLLKDVLFPLRVDSGLE